MLSDLELDSGPTQAERCVGVNDYVNAVVWCDYLYVTQVLF